MSNPFDLQTGSRLQELKIIQLKQANQRLWLLICIIISIFIAAVISVLLVKQKKKYAKRIRQVNEQLASLVQKLNQANEAKEKISQEVKEFLNDKDNRQYFDLLYPLFLAFRKDGHVYGRKNQD